MSLINLSMAAQDTGTMNKTLMAHVAAELVVIGGVALLFNSKIKSLNTRIENLESKLMATDRLLSEQHQMLRSYGDVLQRHDSILPHPVNSQLPTRKRANRPQKKVQPVQVQQIDTDHSSDSDEELTTELEDIKNSRS